MNMNAFGIGMVALAAVALAGCSKPTEPVRDQSGTQESAQAKEQPKAGGVTDWVAGLTSGKKMTCEYAIKGSGESGFAVKMYADKDRYRTAMELPTGKMNSLFDGGVMYSWAEGQKQGTKMDIECAKGLKEEFPQVKADGGMDVQSYDSPEQAIGNIPDISCKETTEAVDFSVPADVQFSDQCAMLKASLGKMKDVRNQLPDSVKGMMPQ